MTRMIAAIAVALAFIASDPCEAGGYFRRVPEVGEWARYEYTSWEIHNIGQEFESVSESKGSLLLKCVGEETIDNERFLWLEQRQEFASTGNEVLRVIKVLVPEEGLVEGTLAVENIRGWEWEMRGETGDDVKPLDLSKDSESPSLPFFLQAFPAPMTGRMEERTIVVDEVEVQLSYVESATLPPVEVPGFVFTGEVAWWPDEDVAFGIASRQQTIYQTDIGKFRADSRYEEGYDLVETGTGAVSELPDHN